MSNKATMFRQQNSPGARAYDDADAVNNEGHPAFEQPLKQRALQLLLTNTLENTFYARASDIARSSHDVYEEILDEDPEFFANAVVYARNEGCMRLQPVVGLVYLSTLEDKTYFHDAFDQVIYTPKDLSDFVRWCKQAGIRNGLGRTVKRAVNRFLNDLSEYHAIKYPMNNRQFSLKNILRLTKPIPEDARQSAIFGYVVDGYTHGLSEDGITWRDCNAHDLDQIASFEALKRAEDGEEQRQLIDEGDLPHEVATGAIDSPSTETWAFIMREMPHFALLRNLNTLQEQGVFDDKENVDYVVDQLTDREIVENVRMLPFRYHTAWLAYTRDRVTRRRASARNHNQRIADALVTALEISVDNLPEIEGRIAIANDISGSMGTPISQHSTTRYEDIAAIFGAAVFSKSPDSILLPFNRGVERPAVSRHDSIMTTAEKIQGSGGGTDVGAPMQWVNENGEDIDVFVGITDGEEWHTKRGGYRRGSKGFYGEWLDRHDGAQDAQAFLVRIDPYETAPTPEDPNVHYISGWSNSVLDYITLQLRGMESQVEHVEQMDITG